MKQSRKTNFLTKKEVYAKKIKIKRILSKKFDTEWKKNKTLIQAKWRRKKKEQQQQQQQSHTSTRNASSPNLSDLRKKEGQKRRTMNTSKLKNENAELRETIQTLTKEIEKLRASRPLTPPPDSPTKFFFDSVSPNAKQRTASRIKGKKETLSRGSSYEIRRKFGINLSKQSLPKKTSQSSLQTEIETFLNRDDITKLCPDKNKQIDGHQIRYRLNHLNILHQQFELESNIDIDYVTFTRYVPSYIKKPNHNDWGTCLCITCLNPQLKYEKLHILKHKYPCIKSIVDSTPIDLYDLASDEKKIDEFKDKLSKLNKEDIFVNFCEWQKKKTNNCVALVSTKVPLTLSIKEFVKKFISEIDVSHIFSLKLGY